MSTDRNERLRDQIATVVREYGWAQNHEELPDTPGEVADAILAIVRTSLADQITPSPKEEGDNGGWSDGFAAGREWAADVVRHGA